MCCGCSEAVHSSSYNVPGPKEGSQTSRAQVDDETVLSVAKAMPLFLTSSPSVPRAGMLEGRPWPDVARPVIARANQCSPCLLVFVPLTQVPRRRTKWPSAHTHLFNPISAYLTLPDVRYGGTHPVHQIINLFQLLKITTPSTSRAQTQ